MRHDDPTEMTEAGTEMTEAGAVVVMMLLAVRLAAARLETAVLDGEQLTVSAAPEHTVLLPGSLTACSLSHWHKPLR